MFAPHSLVGAGTTESEVVQLQHAPDTLMFNHRRQVSFPDPYAGPMLTLC